MNQKNIYSKTPALRNFLESQKLYVLDIGGRGGPIEELKGFSHIANLIIVEPEPSERIALQKSSSLRKEWTTITYMDSILAEKKGNYTLNICAQPGLSSLLKPNLETIDKYYENNSDWLVIDSKSLPGDTLHSQLVKLNIENKIDVIKLDTQGTELTILKSLSKESLSNIKLLYVESEIQEFYLGQPLFGDIHQFLCENGFVLVDLKKTKLRRHSNLDLAFSKQECTWFHLCYKNTSCNTSEDLKTISCLIAAGYLDYAATLITKTTHLSSETKSCLQNDLRRFSRKQFRKNKKRKIKAIIKEILSTIFSKSTKPYTQDKWSDPTLL